MTFLVLWNTNLTLHDASFALIDLEVLECHHRNDKLFVNLFSQSLINVHGRRNRVHRQTIGVLTI
jgi:hypothetical protein